MNKFVIETRNLCKTYQNTPAVTNINLQIESGEFISILGPSGSGKTTLLRMLAGLEESDSGQILLADNDITNIAPYKRPINMVFQNYALFPHMNVFENIAFGLKIKRKLSQNKIKDVVYHALNLVKLSGYDNRYPHQLSGGQQQRVAIARAIVNEPLVLLLDEPLSALDQQIRDEMKDELIYLQKQLNMTFIMVTHDQNDALSLSKRIAIINNGILEQFASASQIYDQPETKFIAKFIGNTNLLTGQIIGNSANELLVEINTGIQLVINQSSLTNSLITLSIRLEKVRLNLKKISNSKNQFPATIIRSQYQGGYTVYSLKINESTLIKAIDTSSVNYQIDSQIWLSINPADIIVFED